MNYREQIRFDDYKVDIRSILNEYNLTGEYGIGYTRKGEKFLFDKEDFDLIKNLPWRISNVKYPTAHVRINGVQMHILMHRLIMDAPQELFVDHIGGNNTKCDNRKCNLRLVTRSQNTINQNRLHRNKYGHVGIRFHYGKWESNIIINGKQIALGNFDTKEEAILSREQAEDKYYGEYSYMNSQEVSKEWLVV